MDLWERSNDAAILPPQYNRQPGRPKTKRIKDASEKATEGTKLGRVQKSLKCSRCGILGHNVKTCHRHLPPKEKISKKRKLDSGKDTTNQFKAKGTKKPPLTKIELRDKVLQKAEKMKNKRDAHKAAAFAAAKTTTAKQQQSRALLQPLHKLLEQTVKLLPLQSLQHQQDHHRGLELERRHENRPRRLRLASQVILY
ncbi:putative transcription factor interactor and regulator CCHC(Zn) family [Rosa chinensis]|uniref:Putative transcription factor interactor and regulator CCHC(Zn) family n=1 Tax=Rosa chinensis TaxID=74649 RepID=A0A2P6SGL5_ROSCH|nr:putative transcription factor interactor and regulator CCHC(Zn) family [Rosa chinensis]